jgi:3-hydroxyacyl-[acyl-carrier-protein] dehydratase
VDSEPQRADTLDRAFIEAHIPHRPPFLFVDRVLAIGPEGITTEWDVSPDAEFFAGHYPGRPIVPGVLLSEFVFQSAALFMSDPDLRPTSGDAMPVLTRIENARFKSMVLPGDTIRAEVSLTEKLSSACYMKATVTCEGRSVLRLSFVVALAAVEEER